MANAEIETLKFGRFDRDLLEPLSQWIGTVVDPCPDFIYNSLVQFTTAYTSSQNGSCTDIPCFLDLMSKIKFQGENGTQEDFARFEKNMRRFIKFTLKAGLYLATLGVMLELTHAYNVRNLPRKTITFWRMYDTYTSERILRSDKMIAQGRVFSHDLYTISVAFDAYKTGRCLMTAYMLSDRLQDGLQMLTETLQNPCFSSDNYQMRHVIHFVVAQFYNYLLFQEYSNCSQKQIKELLFFDLVLKLWMRKYGPLKILFKSKKRVSGVRKSIQVMAIRNFTCSRHKSFKSSSTESVLIPSPMHYYYSHPLAMQYLLLNIARIYLDFPEIETCRVRGPVTWASIKKARKHLRRAARELDSYSSDELQMTTRLVVRLSLLYAGYHYRLAEIMEKSKRVERFYKRKDLYSPNDLQSLPDELKYQLKEIDKAVEELTFAKDLIQNKNILEDGPSAFEFLKFLSGFRETLRRRVVTVSTKMKWVVPAGTYFSNSKLIPTDDMSTENSDKEVLQLFEFQSSGNTDTDRNSDVC